MAEEAAATEPHTALLREEGRHDRSRVSMVELFFDLVFVFAVTQLSHTLLGQLTVPGALQVALLFVAVWWMWIYTTWVTNWVDPDHLAARLMLFALMLGGLLLSASLPEAFGAKGAVFGIAIAAMHVGRSLFMLRAFRGPGNDAGRNFLRITLWLAASGACWIAGGFAPPHARVAWWMLALAIETAGPLLYFRTPWLGRSSIADWNVDPHHMVERCGLFIIIALGESLLVTGATFAEMPWTAPHVAGMLGAFLGTLAMWWLYFDTGSLRAADRFASSPEPGRIARLAYTYLHLPIVAGIVVTAVSDELVLAHPGHATDAGIAAILGGPLLYLLGNAGFKWVANRRKVPPLSHCAGILLLLGVAPFAFGHVFSALALGLLATAVLVLVAAWEWVALRRPSPAGNDMEIA